jgi:hypothetical protein
MACLAATGLLAAATALGQSGYPGDFFTPNITFFPPNPPVFGTVIPNPPPAARLPNVYRNPPAPDGLAAFPNEYFYPALGTRLLFGSLQQKVQARLNQYRHTRDQLVQDLLGKLDELEFADEAVRERELAQLAAQQSPRILSLEDEAEQLRVDLITGGLLGLSVDWSRDQPWSFGVPPTRADLLLQARWRTVRATVYYQKGLTAEQRGLLREIVIELEESLRTARQRALNRGVTDTGPDARTMFFAPETARLILPANLPPALVTRIGTFNSKKAALKQELRDAVFEYDSYSAGRRVSAFTALADRQWPQLVALAELAEQIRRDLAGLPSPKPIRPPSIPADLIRRIQEFNHDIERLKADLAEYVNAQMAPLLQAPENASSDERRGWIQRMVAAQAAARQKAIDEFQRAHRERYDELQSRREIIKTDLTIVAQNQVDPKTGGPMTVDTMLRAFNVSMQQFAALGREEVIYKNYRTAMLLPGLSPEQRRLLFGAAQVGLSQALPNGEKMPTGIFR